MTGCPHCGAQNVLGVWLTRRRAEILERVRRAGRDGLHYLDTPFNRHLLKVHVHQINDVLEETDYKIVGKRAGPWSSYVLEKVR